VLSLYLDERALLFLKSFPPITIVARLASSNYVNLAENMYMRRVLHSVRFEHYKPRAIVIVVKMRKELLDLSFFVF